MPETGGGIERDQTVIEIDVKSGLIAEARQMPSPNCDDRPSGCEPELFIIHGISLPPGEFGGQWIDRLFTNCLDPAEHPYFREIAEQRVSSHLLIRRDGELVQFVPLWKRAWHAGASCYKDRESCNDYSVGIELEGVDTVAYADCQYETLCRTIGGIRGAIPSLATAPIVGHSDVAPDRKTDPGPAFEWHRLDAGLLNRALNQAP